ncbi:MAG: ADP-forming succinate--CoA ligase subunit beta [Armatimonadetes bacterium]|nr:ADP-forming succinate--CoA ligase subunit beta [Armatimonadota bacterium]
MKIHEYQAKEVFGRFGVPVPKGMVCQTPEKAQSYARDLGRAVVVKAQVHVGGRGKAGGVKVARTPEEANEIASAILGMDIKGLSVRKVLCEPAIDIREEYYLGVALDRDSQRNTVIVSAAGGVDIEQVAEETPEKIARLPIDPLLGFQSWHALDVAKRGGLRSDILPQAAKTLRGLVAAYLASDANMAEINPLAVTSDGQVVAADGKMVIDDNALYRQEALQQYYEESEEDEIEAEAHRRGIQYVRLDGTVGVIGNGAGLVMTTLDEVSRAGGKAANFLDIGGGAKAELVRNSLEIVLMNPQVKSVFFNIFGGITRGDEVARGILQAYDELQLSVPIVIRLSGTMAEEGRRLLEGSPLIPAATMQEAAQKAVRLAA